MRHFLRATIVAAAAAAAVAAAATGAGCACGHADTDAGVGPPVWKTVCSDLDDFVLSSWGPAPDDMFFVGGNALASRALLLHYDGERWLRTNGVSDQVLWWVWGTSGTDVWAVGENGEALHYNGSLWTRTCTTPSGCNTVVGLCNPALEPCTTDSDCPPVERPTLYGVWGSASNEVWAVGGSPGPVGPKDVFLYWDGDQWVPGLTDAPSGESIFKVWGTARDDVWAVGTGGVIFHYGGSTWARVPSPTKETLISVWGGAPDDVWAVGGSAAGQLLHWDGTSWTIAADTFTSAGVNGVWTAPGQSPILVGLEGYAGRYRNGTVEPLPTGIREGLHNVFGDGLGEWAVGGNLEDPTAGPGGVILRYGTAPAPCDIGDFDQPLVPVVECGTNTCPGGGGTVGAGEPCLSGNDCECMDGLDCWWVTTCWINGPPCPPSGQAYNHFICTQVCANAAQCQLDYGSGACCIRPGKQTTKTICHSAGFLPVDGDRCMNP